MDARGSKKAMGFEDDLRRIDEHIADAPRMVHRQKGLIIRLRAAAARPGTRREVRKPKLTEHQQAEALGSLARGETLTAIARSYNLSHMTISS